MGHGGHEEVDCEPESYGRSSGEAARGVCLEKGSWVSVTATDK